MADTTTATYSVDYWDVSVVKNVEALPPILGGGDPAYDINPFINTTTLFMIVGDHVLDNALFDSTHQDPAMYCEELYSLFNVQCVAMSKNLYDTLCYTWPREKITFITESMAINGKQFFADYRAAAKVWVSNTDDSIMSKINPDEGITPSQNLPEGVKVPVALTDDIVQEVRDFMYLFAKEVIEDEFERRFLSMAPSGRLEQETWDIQKAEAKLWLSGQAQPGETDFLDYLATSHGRDKTELANKIIEKAKAFEKQVADLLVQQQKILADFQACQNVWDINIQYERYFGLAIPGLQAQAMGLTEGPDSLTRKTPVPYGFQF
jgi:hypothetical protein